MASSDNAATIAAVAAKVRTIGQARTVLGNVSTLLQAAYAKVDDASLWDSADLKSSARGYLDVVNNYAQRLYAGLSAEDAVQAEVIDAHTAASIGLCLAQAQRAVKDVEAAIHANTVDIAGTLVEGLELSASAVGSVANGVAKGSLSALVAFVRSAWLALLLLAVAVALYFAWPLLARKLVRK